MKNNKNRMRDRDKSNAELRKINPKETPTSGLSTASPQALTKAGTKKVNQANTYAIIAIQVANWQPFFIKIMSTFTFFEETYHMWYVSKRGCANLHSRFVGVNILRCSGMCFCVCRNLEKSHTDSMPNLKGVILQNATAH